MGGMVDHRTACEIAADVAAGRQTAESVCRRALAACERADASLNVLIEQFSASAIDQARTIDAARDEGRRLGPLAGVPIVVKDNICTRQGHTTCGSRALAGYAAGYDATVVERLAHAGAVMIGKANLDEFAMGSSGENSAWGPTRNPYAPDRVAGGSSSGSAAAVAAGAVPIALGSDTGGSIRLPAAFCGVVGLRPTYGRVSRYGLVAFASSLDQIGPLAGDVRDAALLLGVIAGHDARDATSIAEPVPDYVAALSDEGLDAVRGVRVGVPRALWSPIEDDAVRVALERVGVVLDDLGVRRIDVDLPHSRYGMSAYYVIAMSEAASNLARYDGVQFGVRASSAGAAEDMVADTRAATLGPEAQRRILLGTFAASAGYTAAYYEKASRVRRRIADDYRTAFEACDVIIGPTAPTVAFPIGARAADPLAMYAADVFTIGASLAGLPALSLPCGADEDGLPIGVHLTGPPHGETLLLQVARMLERELAPASAPGVAPAD
jgi:aspartyl-tRNA(Asn)/glutamyl-tRNA(Gln) amidotransferase subunit A